MLQNIISLVFINSTLLQFNGQSTSFSRSGKLKITGSVFLHRPKQNAATQKCCGVFGQYYVY